MPVSDSLDNRIEKLEGKGFCCDCKRCKARHVNSPSRRRQNVPKSYWVLDFANSSHLVGRTGVRDFVVISDATKIVIISCIVV